MTPDLVVDVGNSRIKWGECGTSGVIERFTSLPGDDPSAWDSQLHAWGQKELLTWAIAGVQPAWEERFTRWARNRGDCVQAITHQQIPISIEVDEPAAVGIDRLLNALAASRLKPEVCQAIVVSVGTAVTVDLVRDSGSFAGGAIFPGPRLMAESLHRFTAKLPLVNTEEGEIASPPGRNTRAAIRAGIAHAIVGGVLSMAEAMSAGRCHETWVVLTGGALASMASFPEKKFAGMLTRPTLALEGIRMASESIP